LKEIGIIVKTQRPNNKKSNLYLLTEKGLALTPTLIELTLWSDCHLRTLHPTIADGEGMKVLRKEAFTSSLVEKYR
jgi:DNA-binding HxlR family transcriptional regulator